MLARRARRCKGLDGMAPNGMIITGRACTATVHACLMNAPAPRNAARAQSINCDQSICGHKVCVCVCVYVFVCVRARACVCVRAHGSMVAAQSGRSRTRDSSLCDRAVSSHAGVGIGACMHTRGPGRAGIEVLSICLL